MNPMYFLSALAFVTGISFASVTLYQNSYSLSIDNPVQFTRSDFETKKSADVKPDNAGWSNGEFSAYSASIDETDARPLEMANGQTVFLGAIACPGFLPFGTMVEVQGLGVYVCADRMNIRYRNKNNFDVFMPSKSIALEFGRKQLQWRTIEM